MEARPGIQLPSRHFSVGGVKWNEDGQLVVCKDETIHIIIPTLVSLSYDIETFQHFGIQAPDPEDVPVFGEKAVVEKPVQTSYIMSEKYRCAAWSPTGLSRVFGCILTLVTTKHRVRLYDASSSEQNGSWDLILDMSERIKEHALDGERDFQNLHHIERFHTLYAQWSPAIIADALIEKPAVLGLSHKSGDITIWGYSHSAGIKHLASIQAHTTFVNLIEWSNWHVCGEGFRAYIISACADGSVGLLQVTVFLDRDNLEKTASVSSAEIVVLEMWFQDTQKISNGISIHTIADNRLRVAVHRNLHLHVSDIALSEDGVQSTWIKTKSQYSAMGFTATYWTENGQCLRAFTFEGEALIFTVTDHGIDLDKALTEQINRKVKYTFVNKWMSLQENQDESELWNKPDGTVELWGADGPRYGLYTALNYTLKPKAISYYGGDAKEVSWLSFILHPPRQDPSTIDQLCQILEASVRDPDFLFTYPIQSVIHEPLEYLADVTETNGILKWLHVLDRLMLLDRTEPSQGTSLTRMALSDIPANAARIAIRVKIELEYYELPDEAQKYLEELKSSASDYLQAHCPSTVLSYILNSGEQTASLDDDDLTTMLVLCNKLATSHLKNIRSLDQTLKGACELILSASTNPSLKENAQKLLYIAEERLAGREVDTSQKLNIEKCAICQEYLKFRYKTYSCSNGHIYGVCSMTNRAMVVPDTRQCLTCHAKCLAPGAWRRLEGGQLSLTDKILYQLPRCLDCGSQLQSI